jgi:hypothetical protein
MLEYKKYNAKRLAIWGDQKYRPVLKQIGARWNSRMRGGPGWLIPIEKEKQLKRLLYDLEQEQKLDVAEAHAQSRHKQTQYHRERSDSEGSMTSTLSHLSLKSAQSPIPRSPVSIQHSTEENSLTMLTESDSPEQGSVVSLRSGEGSVVSLRSGEGSVVSLRSGEGSVVSLRSGEGSVNEDTESVEMDKGSDLENPESFEHMEHSDFPGSVPETISPKSTSETGSPVLETIVEPADTHQNINETPETSDRHVEDSVIEENKGRSHRANNKYRIPKNLINFYKNFSKDRVEFQRFIESQVQHQSAEVSSTSEYSEESSDDGFPHL